MKFHRKRVATHFLASTTLRNALGTRNLSELLNNRPAVSKHVFELMKTMTKQWGVQVVKVEIKDIRLPLQLQKAMAAEAESSRLANAKIIVAKAEIEAMKSLQTATNFFDIFSRCKQLLGMKLTLLYFHSQWIHCERFSIDNLILRFLYILMYLDYIEQTLQKKSEYRKVIH
ncbi:unnamed protein product, partial [Leptidea sinapis]